jgi:ssDNA-binding replication factor A large subunit
MIIADETGTMRVTMWHDQTSHLEKLKEGDIVALKNLYVRDNRGQLELHMNERSEVSINPEGVSINVVEPVVTRKRIDTLQENQTHVEVLGTIVQTFEPRFYEICPECKRRARPTEKGIECQTHGVVTPDFGYVLNLVIDDGSGNIRSVFFNETVRDLLQLDASTVLAYKDNVTGFDEVKMKLLGTVVKVTGRVTRNSMFDRLEFSVNQVDPKPDPVVQ